MDTLLYLLVYPQKPMAKTKHIELINFDQVRLSLHSAYYSGSFFCLTAAVLFVFNARAAARGTERDCRCDVVQRL